MRWTEQGKSRGQKKDKEGAMGGQGRTSGRKGTRKCQGEDAGTKEDQEGTGTGQGRGKDKWTKGGRGGDMEADKEADTTGEKENKGRSRTGQKEGKGRTRRGQGRTRGEAM
jgi:hypothetical protein